jgi:hypothetical protein
MHSMKIIPRKGFSIYLFPMRVLMSGYATFATNGLKC